MREALRHLVADVPPIRADLSPAEHLAACRQRYAVEATEALAAAEALEADLRSWSPWDDDGEPLGYRDTIAEWKRVAGLYHAAGIYAAQSIGDWSNCHGHGEYGDPACPGCVAAMAAAAKTPTTSGAFPQGTFDGPPGEVKGA